MNTKLILKAEKSKGKLETFVEFSINSSKIELIQMLVPLGVEAVNDMMQEEIEMLIGKRYKHTYSEIKRWGSNPGSVYLGGQKIPLKVPRIRNINSNEEVEIKSYKDLQESTSFDEKVYKNVINGISTGKYEKAAEEIVFRG